MREEFAGNTGLIIGGSSGIGKTVSRLLLERGAEAVIIVGKNNQKLRAAELELGSFGKVITNNTTSPTRRPWTFFWQKSITSSPTWICWLTAPEFSSPKLFWSTRTKTTIDTLS